MSQPLTQSEEQQLAQALQSHEVVVWTGKPLVGKIFHSRDWYLVPFSLFWGGFAFFWEFGVTGTKAPGFFTLWGIPFVVMGQYLIWGRFVYDAWLKTRTTYALTNRRVLVLQSGFRFQQNDCTLATLPGTKLELCRDGVGTVDFTGEATSNPFLGAGRQRQAWSSVSRFAFVDVPEAREVRFKILSQQERLLSALHKFEESES